MNPHDLVLRIDDQEKSFHEWTLEYAEKHFPDVDTKVYRIPPFQFNKIGSKAEALDGKKYTVLQQDKTYAKGDKAQAIVCDAFEELGHELGSLAIISNVTFEHYLNKLKETVSKTTTGSHIPSPADKTQRGEMDILVMNLQWGPVVVEVKAVGAEVKDWKTEYMTFMENMKFPLKKALLQVQKDKEVFDHVMQDLQPRPAVTKVIALPYVPQTILNEIRKELRDLCNDPVFFDKRDYATLSEDLEFLCQETLRRAQSFEMRSWWNDIIVSKQRSISKENMKVVVGRFCGLLSTVEVPSAIRPRSEVRTFGEAVSEAGRQFSAVVLTKQQFDILSDEDDSVLEIRGPPGSGKTMLLTLKAHQWMSKRHKIIVVSYESKDRKTYPVSKVLKKMIEDMGSQKVLEITTARVPVGSFNPAKFDEIVLKCGNISRNQIHFIIDEFSYPFDGNMLNYLLNDLRVSVCWSTLINESHLDKSPNRKMFELDTVMRSPPTVQRILGILEWKGDWEHCYVTESVFRGLPTNGPPVEVVYHSRHMNSSSMPAECSECASEIATFLLQKLSVKSFSSPCSSLNVSAGRTQKSKHRREKCKQQRLGCEDVLFLVNTPYRMITERCDELIYNVDREAKGAFWAELAKGPFVEATRHLGLPLEVVDDFDPSIAIPTTHQVVMAIDGSVWGLERKVVVYLPCDVVEDDTEGEAQESEQDDPIIGSSNTSKGETPTASTIPRLLMSSTKPLEITSSSKSESCDGEDKLLDIVRRVAQLENPFYREWLYAAASRSVSQFIIAIPSSWENLCAKRQQGAKKTH